jgi:hypothetical protein
MPQGAQNIVAFLKGGNSNNIPVGPRKNVEFPIPTIPAAAGNNDYYLMAPEDGILDSLEVSFIDALVANDTNYVQFTALNLGQAGAGSVVMTDPTAVNSTRVNGGSGIVANGKKKITLSTSPAVLQVAAGDRIRVRATVTGTLVNTLTGGVLLARFRP